MAVKKEPTKGGRNYEQTLGGRRRNEKGQWVRGKSRLTLGTQDTETHRTCSYCNTRQAIDNFYKDKTKRFGYGYECKGCSSLRRRQRSGMNLTAETLMTLQEITGCEVCGSDKNLNIDHNHDTGNVRGVLCSNCNLAAGQAQDSPTILRLLADYLEER